MIAIRTPRRLDRESWRARDSFPHIPRDDGRMAVERSRWTDACLDALAEHVMRQDVLEARFDSLERGSRDAGRDGRDAH
jgi:hypothetical protein